MWSKNFIFLVIGNLFIYQAFQMLIPILPVYVSQLGGNTLQSSLTVSLVSLSALIFRSISGKELDLLGRQPVLVIGFFILILINISLFWVPIIGVILALRFIQGIGWGITSTSIATVVSDVVPSEKRGEGTGYYAISVILASSLAPIAAIPLMKSFGFHLILIISTFSFIIGLVITQFITYQKKERTPYIEKKRPFWNDLYEKQALVPSFICLLLAFPFGGLMSFIMFFGNEVNLENVWVFYIGHVSMILISRPYMGKLFDRKGHTYVVLPGTLCMIVGLVVLSYSTFIAPLIVASLFYGFGFGSVQPSLQAWAVNRSPSHRRGAANGTFLSSMDLGIGFGTVVLGLVAAQTGYAAMFRLSSLFLLLQAAVYILYILKQKKMENTRRNAPNI